MSSPPLIQYLLWDFGETLSEWRGSSEWLDAYNSQGWQELGPRWSIGEIGAHEAMCYLAEYLNIAESEVHNYLMRADLFHFFPFTHDFFMSKHLPQSIVTINPSLFRQMTISLGINEVSDAIVISGEEGTNDKGALCEVALLRMGVACTNDHVLLIDNKRSNLDAWIDRGGVGYLYTSDTTFKRDVANGIDGLISLDRDT